MRVALDLEEVLADTILEACASTESLEPSDFDTWDIKPGHTWQVYSGVSDALWRHDPCSIPPVETGLDDYTYNIHQKADTLDIVTARLHVDEQIAEWLAENHIYYDKLISTAHPKQELDYDLYIDDNPDMFDECRLLLRDHPHNDHLDCGESEQTDRIFSLGEAEEYL
jgi:hypothetical protein